MHHLFALLIGTIIGVGWITASGIWIIQAGPIGAIIAFAGGAVLMTLIGLCYAEVMAMLPSASGAVGYSYAAFGSRAAFWSGWLLLASYVATCAFFAITLTWLLDILNPAIRGPGLYTVLGDELYLGDVVAIAFVGSILGFTNQLGADIAGGLQTIVVSIKGVLALVLATAAFSAGSAINLSPLITGNTATDSAVAIIGVMVTTPFWFAGFDVLPQALRECAPELNLSRLGRLIIVTTAVALGFYIMIILSASSLVPRAVLLTFQLPTFDAFETAFGGVIFPRVVLALGLVGVLSAWNAMLFAGSRILNAMSAAGLAPAMFAPLSQRRRTPARAVWMISVLGCGLGLLGRHAVNPLVSAASITLVAAFVLLCLALLRLRKTRPNAHRPYRVPTPLLAWVATGLALGLLVLSALGPLLDRHGSLPSEWVVVGVWIALGEIYWRRIRKAAQSNHESIQCALGSS